MFYLNEKSKHDQIENKSVMSVVLLTEFFPFRKTCINKTCLEISIGTVNLRTRTVPQCSACKLHVSTCLVFHFNHLAWC